MIEAALIMPFFMYLLFATIDYGGLFRDYQSLTHVAQAGGRTAAIDGNQPDADYATVVRMRRADVALPAGSVRRIVVWRATDDGSGVPWRKGPASVVPPACATATTGSATYSCNVYTTSAGTIDPPASSAAWSNCANTSNPSRFWCPTSRKAAFQGANSPPDHLGIYIEVLHPFVTGAFGTAKLLAVQLVFTLEASTTQ